MRERKWFFLSLILHKMSERKLILKEIIFICQIAAVFTWVGCKAPCARMDPPTCLFSHKLKLACFKHHATPPFGVLLSYPANHTTSLSLMFAKTLTSSRSKTLRTNSSSHMLGRNEQNTSKQNLQAQQPALVPKATFLSLTRRVCLGRWSQQTPDARSTNFRSKSSWITTRGGLSTISWRS